MKINSKQYAKSLYESINGKEKKEIEQIIKKFVLILSANNDLNKQEVIVFEFLKIWNKEKNIVNAEIASSNVLAKNELKEIENYIKELSKAETVNLNMIQDKTLLGGVVMKYGDKVLDGSLRTRLEGLRVKMKN